jgi:hypothetical protein
LVAAASSPQPRPKARLPGLDRPPAAPPDHDRLDLLAWIDQQETTLAELGQDDVDRWLDEEQTQRRNSARYFLTWTADRGLSRRLTVPAIPRQEPADLLDDDLRWRLLQRCLTDDTLPIGVRAAGALVLLFGLHLQRIRHLSADQITERAVRELMPH